MVYLSRHTFPHCPSFESDGVGQRKCTIRGLYPIRETVAADDSTGCEDVAKVQQENAHRNCLRKWEKISRRGVVGYMKNNPATFRRRLRRGIPSEHRWGVWKTFMLRTNVVAPSREAEEREKLLFSGPNASICVAGLLRTNSAWLGTIQRDAATTFAQSQAFNKDDQASLCRILNAYAFLNPDVGYCQGMSYTAGCLLLASDRSEHEAFFFFVRLMEDCGLSGLYKEGNPLLQQYTQTFELLMALFLPDLQMHFKNEAIETSDYLQNWFLTLFACCLPVQTVLLLWDSIMCNGLETVVLAALALLFSVKEVLLAERREKIMQLFKEMSLTETEDGALAIGWCLSERMARLTEDPVVQRHLNCGAEESRRVRFSIEENSK